MVRILVSDQPVGHWSAAVLPPCPGRAGCWVCKGEGVREDLLGGLVAVGEEARVHRLQVRLIIGHRPPRWPWPHRQAGRQQERVESVRRQQAAVPCLCPTPKQRE